MKQSFAKNPGQTVEVAKERNVSVAWFKLAELISRGEKEKALNLYRLLSYSLDEKAYALQVEGDILWSFEDRDAIDKYKNAAFLYRKEKNIVAAAGVYEHLLTLDPKNVDNLFILLKLYVELEWTERFKDRFNILLELFEEKAFSTDRLREIVGDIVAILKTRCGEQGKDGKIGEILAILENKAPRFAKDVSLM